MTEIWSRQIPSGEGAQGMRDWVNGVPQPMAPLDAQLLGHGARAAVSSGPVTIACALGGLPDQVLMAKGTTLGTLIPVGIDWPTPRLSQNSKYWVGVRYSPPAVVGGKVPDVPPPLVMGPPVPTPTPTPVPTMSKPKISVTRFDGTIREGWEMDWFDGDRAYTLKVIHGSLQISAKNAAGSDTTGAKRIVLSE